MSGLASAVLKEDTAYTYADYKEWDLGVGERYELIYGEAYAMAAPSTKHQMILMELLSQFHAYLQGKPCKVIPAPFDVRLFYAKDESDNTVVQPDITVVCDRRKLGPEGGRGAPDLTVEILSPANTAAEMERKLRLYREAGVREYWVLDPEHKSLNVYNLKDASAFPRAYRSTDTVTVGIFPDLEISLEPVFASGEWGNEK